MSSELTIISASGKVFIAGGYLVLDQKYSGLVVSTSSRFYTIVRGTREKAAGRIHVISPQFKSATWNYSAHVVDDEVEVAQENSDSSKNKFVFIALQQTLKLLLEIKGAVHISDILSDGLDVIIAGENDFYSQREKLAELGLPPLVSSLSKLPAFAHTGTSLADVHKTGLGSSAALITSLVAALLVHFGAVTPSALDSSSTESDGHALIHNTSQFIHCLAQGKVGSGFDVASAVYGSQLYTRFNPNVISKLMSDSPSKEPLLPILGPSNTAWDHKVVPFQLPPFTRLMLADVDAGSDTPSLVGKVLKWRQSAGEEANAFWDSLAASNKALAKAFLHLTELHKLDPSVYTAAVGDLSSLQSSQWEALPGNAVTGAFIAAHNWTEDIRAKMREMGIRSGVPIEPPEQTELLDVCVAQAGVIGGGVPGAGGYDAVWLLVFDLPTSNAGDRPLNRVEQLWASWKKLDVSPLSATESFERGLRVEQPGRVPGLQEILRAN